jgi:hypothetical protein
MIGSVTETCFSVSTSVSFVNITTSVFLTYLSNTQNDQLGICSLFSAIFIYILASLCFLMCTGESCVHETVPDEAQSCKIIFVLREYDVKFVDSGTRRKGIRLKRR